MDISETAFWAAIGIIITFFAIILSIYVSRRTDQKIDAAKQEILQSIRPVNAPGRLQVMDFIDGYPKLPDKKKRETIELALKFRDEQRYDAAIKTFRTLINFNPTKEQHIALLSLIGNTQYLKEDYFSAKKSQCEALDLASSIQNKIAISAASINLGILSHLTGEPDKALEYFNKSLEIDLQLGNELGESNNLGNIGLIYSGKGQLDKALKYYNNALVICRQIGNKLGEANMLGDIGSIYKERGEPEKALEYHTQAMEIDLQIGNKLGEANNLGNIGVIYRDKDEPDKALEFLEKSLKIFKMIKAEHLVKKTEKIISQINMRNNNL